MRAVSSLVFQNVVWLRAHYLFRGNPITSSHRYVPRLFPKRSFTLSSSMSAPNDETKSIERSPDELPKGHVPEELLSNFEEALDRIEADIDSNLKPALSQQREAHQGYLRRLESLVSLPPELAVETPKNRCYGCGVTLQSDFADRPGFVPPDVQSKKRLQEAFPVVEVSSIDVQDEPAAEPQLTEVAPSRAVCQRCYRLTHYGMIEPSLRVPATAGSDDSQTSAELSPVKFRRNLERLQKINCVIIYLVDIFDFHGTFIPSLRDIVGSKNPILLAVNKTDLLPSDMKDNRVEAWIRHECAGMGLFNIDGVHLISSVKGRNVKLLLADAMRIAKRRRSNIYVIGAANVGKSTFINQLVSMLNHKKGKSRTKKGAKRPNTSETLTTSVIPGTTLDVIKIPLGSSINLYDTPGLMMPHQLTNYLDAADLRAVLPSKTVERVSFRLGEGKALFIGGLARIEIVSGKPFFFTSFFSPEVKVHPGKLDDAANFTERHIGGLLKPPSSPEAFERLGEWTGKSLTAEGEGWKRSCLDIVFSGLGWVAVTGSGSMQVRVCVPRGVGVFTREALMPFETQKGVSSYTGSVAVNRKQLRKKKKRY